MVSATGCFLFLTNINIELIMNTKFQKLVDKIKRDLPKSSNLPFSNKKDLYEKHCTSYSESLNKKELEELITDKKFNKCSLDFRYWAGSRDKEVISSAIHVISDYLLQHKKSRDIFVKKATGVFAIYTLDKCSINEKRRITRRLWSKTKDARIKRRMIPYLSKNKLIENYKKEGNKSVRYNMERQMISLGIEVPSTHSVIDYFLAIPLTELDLKSSLNYSLGKEFYRLRINNIDEKTINKVLGKIRDICSVFDVKKEDKADFCLKYIVLKLSYHMSKKDFINNLDIPGYLTDKNLWWNSSRNASKIFKDSIQSNWS